MTTALELRSDIAMVQAQVAILYENARALDEIECAGQLDLAADHLLRAFSRLDWAVRDSGGQLSSYFGRPGEAPEYGV